jgi:hypothetical protein
MSKPRIRLPSGIREELDATGLPWEAVSGAKHVHILIGGVLAAVISRGARARDVGRLNANLRADIRRAARQRSSEPA